MDQLSVGSLPNLDNAVASVSRQSSLERFALAGLQRCWMPVRGTWSHQYHLDGRAQPNTSRPASDLYYSINVLLGLSALSSPCAQYGNMSDLLHNLVCDAERNKVRNGLWGMALWAAACLDVSAPAAAATRVRNIANNTASLTAWRAQDLGLTLSGACAQARRDPKWMSYAHKLQVALLRNLCSKGALFRDSARGPRRYVASFATQVYATLALYHYGELTGDEESLRAANACVQVLIELQGGRGEWPWFYSPESGRVLDFYEVYSVHQHGMAPAILHHGIAHGVTGAREAMIKGFEWVFGNNNLGVSMLRSDLCMIVRSQRRRFPYDSRAIRLARAVTCALTGHGAGPARAEALALTPEMRSYEFGWLLWSFAGRHDYGQLTEHPAFTAQGNISSHSTALQRVPIDGLVTSVN